MFALLHIEQKPEGGVLQKLLHRLTKHRLHLQTVETPFGCYTQLTARTTEINWDKAAALLGRAAENLVLPQELPLPEGCGLRRFVPELLALTVLHNTALKIIRQTKLPLYRKIATLVDLDGDYTALVEELLCHCITVKVVTHEVARYEALSEEMMEELGASIVVSESFSLCEGSLLVLAPDSRQAREIPAALPVLTLRESEAPLLCQTVCVQEVRLPRELTRFLPAGIAPLDFAGAFCQFCGWKGGKELSASTLSCKSNRLSVEEITKYIERGANNSSSFNRNKAMQA